MNVDPLVAHLREIRVKQGVAQVEIADLVKTSQSAVSEMETGHASPTLRTLRRVAAALGYDLVLVKRRAS